MLRNVDHSRNRKSTHTMNICTQLWLYDKPTMSKSWVTAAAMQTAMTYYSLNVVVRVQTSAGYTDHVGCLQTMG